MTEYLKIFFTHQGRLKRLPFILLFWGCLFVSSFVFLATIFLLALIPSLMPFYALTILKFFMHHHILTVLLILNIIGSVVFWFPFYILPFLIIIQRLHDTNRSGKFILYNYILIIYNYIFF